MRRSRLGIVITALALAAAMAACGDDEEQGGGSEAAAKPRVVRIELTESGFEVPKTVPGGVVRIEFTNSAPGMHSAQLGYADEGHTAQEALESASAWAERGAPLPDWAHTAGGTGRTPSGATVSVTQELSPGRYFVLDVEAEEEVASFFEVTAAEGEAELPETPARIEAIDYSFESTGLTAGAGRVLVENTGGEPHFVEAAPLTEGSTIADVRRFIRTEKGRPPADFERSFSTAVIDGGLGQVVELDFERGDYALLCFVPDRAGGPPHALKGMISQATVR
jgi:hypothetical protein